MKRQVLFFQDSILERDGFIMFQKHKCSKEVVHVVSVTSTKVSSARNERAEKTTNQARLSYAAGHSRVLHKGQVKGDRI